MKRLVNAIILAAFVSIATSCSRMPDTSREHCLNELPQKSIEAAQEWRTARQFPPGADQVVRMPGLPMPTAPPCRLRLGIFEGAPAATLRIYLGDRLVHSIETGTESVWRDYDIPLPAAPAPDTPCRIVTHAQQALWIAPCEIVSPASTRPNVLIYLVDTLRLDHLSAYGYSRNTSPNFDVLCQESVLFTQLMPQSSWTKPSVASLLTSAYPNRHGAQDRPDMLRKGVPSLAAALQRAGYETQGFITNTNLLPLWGFGGGFSRYVNVDAADFVNCDDAHVVDKAIQAIHHLQGRPWFLYVHAMGPHGPYEAPGEFKEKFARTQFDAGQEKQQRALDLYDGEIAYSDMQFQRLLNTLRERGCFDNTLIVFLSDHGEEFWEHGGDDHGKTLYEEVLRVPLLIKMPHSRLGGERRDALIEMVDIAPTLMDCLKLPREPDFQGQSFRILLETGQQEPRMGYATLVNLAASLRTAKTTDIKFLFDAGARRESWFDLRQDPAEIAPFSQPLPGGETLRAHAARMGIRGAEGLHILMTCGDQPRRVHGKVTGTGFGMADVQYYDWKSTLRQDPEVIEFEWLTKHPADSANQRDVWHTRYAEQDNAHLRIPMPCDTLFQLHIDIDGNPPPSDAIFLGLPPYAPIPVAGWTLRPMDLLADSDHFDPAGLPRTFALYIWFVAPPDSIPKEDLDPKIRENLQALGYL